MVSGTDSLFSFTDGPAQDMAEFGGEHFPDKTLRSLSGDGMAKAQAAAEEVSYHWNVASDEISWSANAAALLGCKPESIATGRKFALLLDGNNFTSRYDTVMHGKDRDSGAGVPFKIEYMLRPKGRHADVSMWIEDAGRWFAGRDGAAADVFGVMRLSNDRHDKDQELAYLSSCDALTGMMNRARMADSLKDAISVATMDKNPCAFAILAVNNLDVMNEAYGFEVADDVIVELGNRLRKVMRAGDAIARYSGSKFGIILNNCKAEELEAALERFMRAVRDSVIETKLGPVWALLSIGAVSLPALGDNVNTAIAHAEEALSEAFRHPGDSKVVFTSSDVRTARRALNARCATEIVACLRNNLFKLAFQPICDARTGDVVMHEALLRMTDSSGDLITAGHLVPIAEQLGLVRLIDRAVLQLALNTLETYPDSRLSVNISATTANDPRWNAQLLDMIAAVPELARRMVIEVTETTALGDVVPLREFMDGIRATGCGIALDDFGAGYTSFQNIKELPLSHIKLDGSYCQNLDTSASNRMFVESLVKLGNGLGLKIVAEWVETEADAQILRDLGVHYLQGHYWGEASVVAPWARTQALHFELSPGQAAAETAAPAARAPQPAATVQEDLVEPHHTEESTAAMPEPVLEDVETMAPVEVQAEVGEPGVDAPLAAAEPETAADDQEHDIDWSEPEDGLSKLKDVLAELNAVFGQPANESAKTDEQRLAS